MKGALRVKRLAETVAEKGGAPEFAVNLAISALQTLAKHPRVQFTHTPSATVQQRGRGGATSTSAMIVAILSDPEKVPAAAREPDLPSKDTPKGWHRALCVFRSETPLKIFVGDGVPAAEAKTSGFAVAAARIVRDEHHGERVGARVDALNADHISRMMKDVDGTPGGGAVFVGKLIVMIDISALEPAGAGAAAPSDDCICPYDLLYEIGT